MCVSMLVCYCGSVDEVARCGSVRAARFNLAGVEPIEDELEECDVEMFLSTELESDVAKSEFSNQALFVGTVFSCEKVCGRQLECKRHSCEAVCHRGDCEPCAFLPENCLVCPCGQVPLNRLVSREESHSF